MPAKKPKQILAGQAIRFNELFAKVAQFVDNHLPKVEDSYQGEAEVVDDGTAIERKFEIVSGDVTYTMTMRVRRNQD